MRPKRKGIGRNLLGLVLAATLGAGVRPANAWQYTVDGDCALEIAGVPTDAATSVVVDSVGDIIAGGRIGASPLISNGLVVKLSGRLGAPAVLWQTDLTSAYPSPTNSVHQVALDGAGDVFVAGVAGRMDESYNLNQFLMVAKLDGTTGAILWQQEPALSAGFNSYFLGAEGVLAVDSAGNVILAGRGNPDGDSLVLKFDGATGTQLWQAVGPARSDVMAVAVDHADNVLAAGYEEGGAVVAKYDGATGAAAWEVVDPAGRQFQAVAVDASNNVVVAGAGGTGSDSTFWVKKLDTNGTGMWSFDSPGVSANGLVFDSAGNVFATGVVTVGTDWKMGTFKLDGATGEMLWQSISAGTGESGNAITLDPSGNPVVSGSLKPAARSTMGILKLDPATGTELWHALVDGTGTDNTPPQQAYTVAVDPRGDVVAGGILNPVTGNYGDFAVVKRNGADGTDFMQLCGNGVVEGTETCDDGNTTSGDGCSATCQTEAGFLCQGEPSTCVATIGVVPKKLVVVDKLATSSASAKTVFAAKDKNVTKGAGTDPTAISATFTAAYANGAARGGFAVPAGAGWLVNTAKVAKYVNKSAPAGPTQTKVALIRPGSALSLTAKGIGDTPFDILTAGDPAGDVHTAYCVTNGGATICHCSVNQNCVFTKVAGDTGAKLACKGGAADPTCAALLP